MFSFEKLKSACGGQLELTKTIFDEIKREFKESHLKYIQFYEAKNSKEAAFQFHKIINLVLLALDNSDIEKFVRNYENEIKANNWENHSNYLEISMEFEKFLYSN